jgi:hypothetical protein
MQAPLEESTYQGPIILISSTLPIEPIAPMLNRQVSPAGPPIVD